MTKIRQEVLELFRKNSEADFSTSRIARKIYNKEYEKVLDILSGDFPTKEEKKKAKRKKSKIHRRILHHLNKLVEREILEVTRRGENGEKFFGLAIEPGEEIVYDTVRKKKVEISRPVIPSLPIENLGKEGTIKRLEKDNWIQKLDSIMLESKKFDKNNIYHVITTSLDYINDVLGINSFENVVSELSTDELMKFFHKLTRDLDDFNKAVSLIIDFSRLEIDDRKKFLMILKDIEYHQNLNMVFELDSGTLNQQKNYFEELVPIISDHNIYFKNKNIDDVPLWVGHAGPYTFNKKKWEKQKEKTKMANSLCCSQSTLFVDFKKFMGHKNSLDRENFRNLFEKAYRSLFIGSSIQRKQKHSLFSKILSINEEGSRKEFFIYSRNYLRTWNLETISSRFDNKTAVNLLEHLKKDMDEFCAAESTIYKSCGMPIEFKIAMAPGYGDKPEKILSREKNKIPLVSGVEDIYSEYFRETVELRDRLSHVNDGGNIITIRRKGGASNSDIIQEINAIINTYGFKLFRYQIGNSLNKDSSIERFLR